MGSLRFLKQRGIRNRFTDHSRGFSWREGGHYFNLFYGEYTRKVFLEIKIGGQVYKDLGDVGWNMDKETGRILLNRLRHDLVLQEEPWNEVLKYPRGWSRSDKNWKRLFTRGET